MTEMSAMVMPPGKARMMSPRASTQVLAPEAEVPAPPASPRNIVYKETRALRALLGCLSQLEEVQP
jgi:hypothetical protein